MAAPLSVYEIMQRYEEDRQRREQERNDEAKEMQANLYGCEGREELEQLMRQCGRRVDF